MTPVHSGGGRQGCRLSLGHPWPPVRDGPHSVCADQGAERITTCKTPGESSAGDVDKEPPVKFN